MRTIALHNLKILTIGLFIVSCQDPKPRIDSTGNEVQCTIQRLDLDLFQREEGKSLSFEEYNDMRKSNGDFFSLFVERIIAVGRAEDSSTLYYLNRFLGDLQVWEVAQVTLNLYPDLEMENAAFSQAFSNYNVLFPDQEIPSLYSYISGFSYPMVVDSNMLGIGLDFYLGSDQDYYRLLGIPKYKSHNLNRVNIVPEAMKSWIITEFDLESENSDLLSHMVYHGKILYALELILPDVPDSVLIGFSPEQMTWLQSNEKDMWFHFAENELLYTKEGKEIQKYIGEGPFTPGFPDGSPGMTGRWIGWQIVRAYMNETGPLEVKDLFATTEAQRILTISKYKPK